jgi:hypothetical protein
VVVGTEAGTVVGEVEIVGATAVVTTEVRTVGVAVVANTKVGIMAEPTGVLTWVIPMVGCSEATLLAKTGTETWAVSLKIISD